MSISNCDDRGVRHTKTRIRNAYIELLSQKPFNKITVKELVESADINRGTFYFHYIDIYDLLDQLELEIYHSFEVVMAPPYTSAHELILDILEISKNNSQMICLLLGSNGDPRFLNHLKAMLKSNLLALWTSLHINTDSAKVQIYSTFLIQGFIGVVEEWLKNDASPSANELTGTYASTLRSSYHVFMDSIKDL